MLCPLPAHSSSLSLIVTPHVKLDKVKLLALAHHGPAQPPQLLFPSYSLASGLDSVSERWSLLRVEELLTP